MKVRETLMKDLEGVADVFAGVDTVIHLKEDTELSEAAVKAALKKHKMELKSLEKDQSYLL